LPEDGIKLIPEIGIGASQVGNVIGSSLCLPGYFDGITYLLPARQEQERGNSEKEQSSHFNYNRVNRQPESSTIPAHTPYQLLYNIVAFAGVLL
jgi:hypothetical protein